jgi:hypothetical protein
MCQIRSVQLELSGMEETAWKIVRNDRRHNEKTGQFEDNWKIEHHSGKHEFFRTAVPVTQGSVLGLGQFSIPFSMRLPGGLPGSCEIGRNPHQHSVPHTEEYHWGKCSYEIHAYAETHNGNIFSRCRELAAHERINILNIPPPPRDCVSKADAQVNVCCCINKGTCHIEMTTGKDSYKIGDPVIVDAKFDNQSTAELKDLNLRLHRIVTLKDARGITKHMNDEIKRSVHPGCAPNQKKGERFVMNIPNNHLVVPTCTGNLMKVKYVLMASGSVTCASSPKTEIPITMFKYAEFYQKPQIAQWQPTVLPVAVVPTIQVSLGGVPMMDMSHVNRGHLNGQVTTTTTTTHQSAYGAGYGGQGVTQVKETTTISSGQPQMAYGTMAMAPQQPPMMQQPMVHHQQPMVHHQQQGSFNQQVVTHRQVPQAPPMPTQQTTVQQQNQRGDYTNTQVTDYANGARVVEQEKFEKGGLLDY